MSRQLEEALLKAFQSMLTKPEVTGEPSSIPGFLEYPSDGTSCEGCWFVGIVLMTQCPFPRCCSVSRRDNRDIIYSRGPHA